MMKSLSGATYGPRWEPKALLHMKLRPDRKHLIVRFYIILKLLFLIWACLILMALKLRAACASGLKRPLSSFRSERPKTTRLLPSTREQMITSPNLLAQVNLWRAFVSRYGGRPRAP